MISLALLREHAGDWTPANDMAAVDKRELLALVEAAEAAQAAEEALRDAIFVRVTGGSDEAHLHNDVVAVADSLRAALEPFTAEAADAV